MDNNETLFILALLIAALIFWLTVLRQKVIALEAARAEARRRLRAERDNMLAKIRSEAPGFILRSSKEFEQEYRSKGSVTTFGQDMSPLLCFGYRVGTAKGRSEADRRAILTYCLAVDLDATLSFLPADYLAEWGAPMSVQRFSRIYNHLTSRADIHDGRANLAVAVQQWRDDASWFHGSKIADVQRFHAL